MEDIQKVILNNAGKGTILRNKKGDWSNQELIIDNSLKGMVRNLDGDWVETNTFKIHYSKKRGTHLVPTLGRVKSL